MEVSITEKTKKLVDQAVKFKKQEKKAKEEYNKIVAELAEICERTLQDKGVKSSIVYGTGGNAAVITSPVKVNVVSYEKLIAAMGKNMIEEYAPVKEVTPERKPTDAFSQVMADIVLGHYIDDDLGRFLETSFDLSAEQKALLIKKLKGVYDKDHKALVSVLGEADYDVELYYISRILSYQRIKRHLPSDMLTAIEAIKEAVAVDEGVRTEIVYKE